MPVLARTHNLKFHIEDVHQGKRKFPCHEAGCERSFSRKHDLERHHQSAHTDLGSPRNPNGAKKAKKAKVVVKKDENDVRDN